MERPALKIGDIVKLSKKGKTYSREFSKDASLIVSHVNGDGVDRHSLIMCKTKVDGKYRYFKFYRSELWYTGKNAFKKRANVRKDNNGHKRCLACRCLTGKIHGIDICVNVECEWYRN